MLLVCSPFADASIVVKWLFNPSYLSYQLSCSRLFIWQPEPVLEIVLSISITTMKKNKSQVTCVFQILVLMNALYGLKNCWSQIVIRVSPRHSHILHSLLSTGFHLNHIFEDQKLRGVMGATWTMTDSTLSSPSLFLFSTKLLPCSRSWAAP